MTSVPSLNVTPATIFGNRFWLWRTFGADRQPVSPRLDHSSAQGVDLAATVHLPLDELKFGDLALGLAVGPGLDDGGPHGGLVVPNAAGEGREFAVDSVSEPAATVVVAPSLSYA